MPNFVVTLAQDQEQFVICPDCGGPVALGDDQATCGNGHAFQVVGGSIDFMGEAPLDAGYLSPDHSCECAGMVARTDTYIIPWLRRQFGDLGGLRVLEDGCGMGATVDRLVSAGVDAYGIDPGQRNEHWAELGVVDRLWVADGTNLPFADCSFDAVLSSGVLEHVGEPRPRRELHPHQRKYMEEIVRVLKPNGLALVAHPNGAHPLDFWHPARWSIRPHVPYEVWMPNSFEVRSWVGSSPHAADIQFLTPEGYMAFERVQAHWYGRAFAGAMKSLFRLISRFPKLAATPINPWLVTEIRRLP